jgi:hypothetical protein
MAKAWHALTGHLPAKHNTKFHTLLAAAIGTIFSEPTKEPNLESATRIAVRRIAKNAATRS